MDVLRESLGSPLLKSLPALPQQTRLSGDQQRHFDSNKQLPQRPLPPQPPPKASAKMAVNIALGVAPVHGLERRSPGLGVTIVPELASKTPLSVETGSIARRPVGGGIVKSPNDGNGHNQNRISVASVSSMYSEPSSPRPRDSDDDISFVSGRSEDGIELEKLAVDVHEYQAVDSTQNPFDDETNSPNTNYSTSVSSTQSSPQRERLWKRRSVHSEHSVHIPSLVLTRSNGYTDVQPVLESIANANPPPTQPLPPIPPKHPRHKANHVSSLLSNLNANSQAPIPARPAPSQEDAMKKLKQLKLFKSKKDLRGDEGSDEDVQLTNAEASVLHATQADASGLGMYPGSSTAHNSMSNENLAPPKGSKAFSFGSNENITISDRSQYTSPTSLATKKSEESLTPSESLTITTERIEEARQQELRTQITRKPLKNSAEAPSYPQRGNRSATTSPPTSSTNVKPPLPPLSTRRLPEYRSLSSPVSANATTCQQPKSPTSDRDMLPSQSPGAGIIGVRLNSGRPWPFPAGVPLRSDKLVPAPPITGQQIQCLSQHAVLRPSGNKWHPVGCMVCSVLDSAERFACPTCNLRVCRICKGELEDTKERDLVVLLGVLGLEDKIPAPL